MKNIKYLLTFLLLFSVFVNKLNAQTEQLLGDKLQNVVEAYALEYLKPVNTALGITLNSGLFTMSNSSSLDNPVQLRFYAGVKAFGYIVKDENKKFNLRYIDTVTQGGVSRPFEFTVTDAPTFFGSSTPGTAFYRDNSGVQQSQQTIGGIYRSDIAPFVMLHLEAGSVFGTDVMLRFLPKVSLGKLEDISAIGFGIRHNISQYFTMMPVDITVQGALQKVTLNSNNVEIVNSNAKVINIMVSKKILLLNLYAGVQYDNLSTEIRYQYRTTNGVLVPVEFEMPDVNNTAGILGAGINLGGLYLNLDANFGKYMVITAGAGYNY